MLILLHASNRLGLIDVNALLKLDVETVVL